MRPTWAFSWDCRRKSAYRASTFSDLTAVVGGPVPANYSRAAGSARRVFRKGSREETLSFEASFRTSTCLKGPGGRSDAAAPQNRKLLATEGGLRGGVGVAFMSRRIYLRQLFFFKHSFPLLSKIRKCYDFKFILVAFRKQKKTTATCCFKRSLISCFA